VLNFFFKEISRRSAILCCSHTSFASSGEAQRHEFQAETRQLLDIVAKTLYSEKEVQKCSSSNLGLVQCLFSFGGGGRGLMPTIVNFYNLKKE